MTVKGNIHLKSANYHQETSSVVVEESTEREIEMHAEAVCVDVRPVSSALPAPGAEFAACVLVRAACLSLLLRSAGRKDCYSTTNQ